MCLPADWKFDLPTMHLKTHPQVNWHELPVSALTHIGKTLEYLRHMSAQVCDVVFSVTAGGTLAPPSAAVIRACIPHSLQALLQVLGLKGAHGAGHKGQTLNVRRKARFNCNSVVLDLLHTLAPRYTAPHLKSISPPLLSDVIIALYAAPFQSRFRCTSVPG